MILALGMSAVSLYYYLKVLKQIYVVEPRQGVEEPSTPLSLQAVLVVIAFGVLILGCAPDLLLGRLTAAIEAATATVAMH